MRAVTVAAMPTGLILSHKSSSLLLKSRVFVVEPSDSSEKSKQLVVNVSTKAEGTGDDAAD
jgi:hypothetical protein